MPKLTQDMKNVIGKSDPFIFATASKDGKPNAVPVGLCKVISDDELLLADISMVKNRRNIAENPVAAVTAWDFGVHYGYQFKGKVCVETAGKLFEEAVALLNSRPGDLKLKVKAAVIVKVQEVYYVGSIKDSSIDLWK